MGFAAPVLAAGGTAAAGMSAGTAAMLGGGIGMAAGSMMGGRGGGGGGTTNITDRDPVDDYRRMYEMQADIQRGTGAFSDLGPQVALEEEMRPRWMDLQTSTLRQAAEGMLPTYAQQIQPQLSQMESAANRYRRTADIDDALSLQPRIAELGRRDADLSRELTTARRGQDIDDVLSMQPDISRMREMDVTDALSEESRRRTTGVDDALSLQPRMAELRMADARGEIERTGVRRLADVADAETLAPRVSAMQAEANRFQRGADVSDIEAYGGRAAAATLGADPMTKQASDLAMERSMALMDEPLRLRRRQQQIAAAQGRRGLARSPFAAAEEAYMLDQEGDEQRMRRIANLGAVTGQRRALTGDTWGQVTGRPGPQFGVGQALGGRQPAFSSLADVAGVPTRPYSTMAEALGGQAQPFASLPQALGGGGQAFGAMGGYGGQAGAMGQQFGPQIFGESQLFQDILAGNQQQRMAQQQSQAMMNSAQTSGMLGMGGRILGGAFSGGFFNS